MLMRSIRWTSLKAWGVKLMKTKGHRRRGPQDRRHPAPHVGRRFELPLGIGGCGMT
jgi:hypothetical protein